MILGTTILLILGTIDICQVFMQMQYMNERARAASRWAAAKWDPTTSTASVKNYAVFLALPRLRAAAPELWVWLRAMSVCP